MRFQLRLIVLPVAVMLAAACGTASVGNSASTTSAAPAGSAGSSGAAGTSEGAVKLGIMGPMTGAASTYGIAERNGIQMAVDQVNANGGLLGNKVQVEIRDDKADPSVATTQALELVQSQKVNALFGPIINTNALAVAKMSDQLGVPVLGTLGATTPVVYPNGTDKPPYQWVYRVLVSSPVQVKALIKYGTAKGWKRWAMMYENDAYGQPTVNDLQAALKGTGGELVSKQAIAVDATDATAQALAVKASNPDVVLVWTIQAPASKIVSALSASGSTVPILSSNAQVSPQFYQLAGKLANGIISTGLKAQFDSSPAVTAFTKSYTEKFKIAPTLWAYASYDAANLYFAVVKKAGGASPAAVRPGLNATTYTGLTGTIGFTAQNHDGLTAKDVEVVKLQDSKATPVS